MNPKMPASILAVLMLAGATTVACGEGTIDAPEGVDEDPKAPVTDPADPAAEPPVSDAGSDGAKGTAPADAGRDASPGRDAAPPPPPPVDVGWIGGTYFVTGKTENNVQFSSDNRSITFYPSTKTYSYTLGRTQTSSGAFVAETTAIRFTTGPLVGKSVAFAADVSENCRIVRVNGSLLSKGAVVAGCPFVRAPLTSAECARRGTYTKTTKSGSIGSSGSGSESSYTTRITLEKDRFYRYETSSSRTTCFQFECKTLYNDAQDLVGSWALSGSTITGPSTTLADLATYTFAPGAGACP